MAQSGGRPQSQPVAAANVLDGFLSLTGGAAATTFLTVPAGRTWVGTVSISTDNMVAPTSTAAGFVLGIVSILGAGATPPAGTIFQVGCRCGPNTATGTVSSQAANTGSIPLQITAPAGNSVALQLAVTLTGSAGEVSCTAAGALQ